MTDIDTLRLTVVRALRTYVRRIEAQLYAEQSSLRTTGSQARNDRLRKDVQKRAQREYMMAHARMCVLREEWLIADAAYRVACAKRRPTLEAAHALLREWSPAYGDTAIERDACRWLGLPMSHHDVPEDSNAG